MRFEQLGGGLVVAQTAEFRFGTDALLLTAFAQPHKAGLSVCDLGTGCGIIPFLLQTRPRTPAYTLGVDLQAEAIALCEAAKQKNQTDSVSFLQADWCDPVSIAPAGSFDTVICNPPYFSGGKQNESEARSIARHAKATTLLEVCAAARHLLKFGGRLYMCHRPENLASLFAAMQQNGLEPKRLQTVQSDINTPVQLVLVQAVKGAKAGLRFELPWLLSDEKTHDFIYGLYKI